MTQINEAMSEYLRLQGEMKEIKRKMDEVKKVIVDFAEQRGPQEYKNHVFKIQERVSYRYDPEKLKKAIGEDAAKLVIVEEVDAKKLQGLVKGGIVSKEAIEEAKEETRRTKALVVREKKGDKDGN